MIAVSRADPAARAGRLSILVASVMTMPVAADRGRGIGTRALAWLTEHVFTTAAGASRIEGTTRQDNVAMRRLFRRGGYVKESHYRDGWPDPDGNLHDAIGYAILRRDWLAGPTTVLRWDDEPA